MYTITFYNKNNGRTDFCEFGLIEGEHFLDKLEEVLYIMQELTPCTNRCSWAFPFLRGEAVRFTYHKCEFVTVQLMNNQKIIVKDI